MDASERRMSDQEKQLETVLRNRGLAWAIDMFPPSSHATAHYLQALSQLEDYFKARGLSTISFSPDSLEQLVSVSPYKADAFLQALVSICSTPILCAAWRILQGMEVQSIEMRVRSPVRLHVARHPAFALQRA